MLIGISYLSLPLSKFASGSWAYVCVWVSVWSEKFVRRVSTQHLALDKEEYDEEENRRKEKQMKRDARNRRRYVQVLRKPHRHRSHSHKLYREKETKKRMLCVYCRFSGFSRRFAEAFFFFYISFFFRFVSLSLSQLSFLAIKDAHSYFPSLFYFCGAKVVDDVCVNTHTNQRRR